MLPMALTLTRMSCRRTVCTDTGCTGLAPPKRRAPDPAPGPPPGALAAGVVVAASASLR